MLCRNTQVGEQSAHLQTLDQLPSSRNQVKAVTDCESFCTAADGLAILSGAS